MSRNMNFVNSKHSLGDSFLEELAIAKTAKYFLCFNPPKKWETLPRMKYVLCSVRKGNTNNMMEKKWLCEILHIAGLFNSENPIHNTTEKTH